MTNHPNPKEEKLPGEGAKKPVTVVDSSSGGINEIHDWFLSDGTMITCSPSELKLYLNIVNKHLVSPTSPKAGKKPLEEITEEDLRGVAIATGYPADLKDSTLIGLGRSTVTTFELKGIYHLNIPAYQYLEHRGYQLQRYYPSDPSEGERELIEALERIVKLTDGFLIQEVFDANQVAKAAIAKAKEER